MKLIAFNVSDGTVEIHKAGCADIKRGNKGRFRRSDQVEFGTTDWPTQYAFAYDYWDNGILAENEAENGEGSFDVFQEMDFKPCCDALPVGGREEVTVESHKIGCRDNGCHGECLGEPEPAKRGSNALRKEAREALWKGIENMLNDTVYKSQPELYAMMVAQSERVAYMFGMRDEK